jgi:hypothetical protein
MREMYSPIVEGIYNGFAILATLPDTLIFVDTPPIIPSESLTSLPSINPNPNPDSGISSNPNSYYNHLWKLIPVGSALFMGLGYRSTTISAIKNSTDSYLLPKSHIIPNTIYYSVLGITAFSAVV